MAKSGSIPIYGRAAFSRISLNESDRHLNKFNGFFQMSWSSGSHDPNCGIIKLTKRKDGDLIHVEWFTVIKRETLINMDGVWNLVLSCQSCNRGANDKFALLPDIKYLEKLHNEITF
ncbi:hypothetical protein [Paenibacillus periandrae]|uniref:hypothetical protein n=1 Tax=Paenibacillus periandrae TaxID=1761741 RepID=UPI001F094C78|nr:hypothetical protein [Paenibacillus periandrae]